MQAKHFVLRVVCLCFVFFTQTSVVKSQEHNKLYETSKARAQENNTASAPSLFEVSEVIPDVLDKPPQTVLEVKYGFTPVKLGQELTPAELVNEPEVNWNADPDKFYTLLFSYPDLPTRKRPIFREGRLWLVVNIPGKNISAGEVICVYSRPTPPEGTGLHRFIFLLFEQPEKLVFEEPKAVEVFSELRIKTSAKKFAEKYKLGDPIAGTFFEAQWDESVPRIYEQLAALKALGVDYTRHL